MPRSGLIGRSSGSTDDFREQPWSVILNKMVQYSPTIGIDGRSPPSPDPTRRSVLERLGKGNATITELAEPFGISLTGMKKHVRVLEEAGLVRTEKVGRARHCSLGERRLDDVEAWIETYRRMLDERLDRFGELLERKKRSSNDRRHTAAQGDRNDAGRARDPHRARVRRTSRPGFRHDARSRAHSRVVGTARDDDARRLHGPEDRRALALRRPGFATATRPVSSAPTAR